MVEMVVEIVDAAVHVQSAVLDAYEPSPLRKGHLCRHRAVLVDYRLDRRHDCAELVQMDEWRWIHQ